MRSALIAAALLIAAPAVAQQPPRQDDDEVVVRGTPLDSEAVGNFVRALTGPSGGTDPIGRPHDAPICPGVVGLREDRNTAIADRIRRVAAAAGMTTAGAPCRPNVLVILTRNKEEMIRALRQRYSALFSDGSARVRRIREEPGPAAAWHVERRFDRSGMPVGYDVVSGTFVVTSPIEPSRISAAMRTVFVASVVVIELDALIGLTLTQIADYAAMRAFTQVNPAQLKAADVPTILSAIEAPEGAPVPITLTQWDMSYLRALMATPAYHYSPRQRSRIRSRMMDELQSEEGSN